jgi:hypothetical protein
VQTDIQRIEWLRQHGWRVEGEAVIEGQPVRWIESGAASAWLRIVDGMILWHGADDQTFADFVESQTKPAKAKPKPKTLFGDDDE